MIVPQYWAEARVRERVRGRQVTVRRFGWSDVSPADAQSHAEARAREAFERIRVGAALERREPKVAYNGPTEPRSGRRCSTGTGRSWSPGTATGHAA